MNLKSLKSLIIEDDPIPVPAPKATGRAPYVKPLDPSTVVVSNTVSSNSATYSFRQTQSESVDQEMVQNIRGKLANCPEQITINKLTTVMESLRRFIPDEKQRYQAALEQMRLSGVQAADIGSAFDGLLHRLADQSQKFTAACGAQKDALQPKQEDLDAKKEELRVKQAELDQLRGDIATITADVATQEQKINHAASRFAAAAAQVQSEIVFAGQQVRQFVGDAEKI